MLLIARVFLPFALAYTVTYLLRVVNAVAGEPICADLGLDASDLGLLTSVFFVGFALAQVPLGVLMDRYGARRVEAAVLLLAALGCAIFALASSFAELFVGRILMGIGCSMGLMAPFTAFRRWFSAARMPLIVALQMSFGAVGSSLGGYPTEVLLVHLGWHGLFALLCFATLAMSALIYLVVPRRNEPGSGETMATMLSDVRRIAVSRALWRIAPLSATTQAGFLAVLSLWTGPWLREVAGYTSAEAGAWLSIIAAGLIIGFVGYGLITSFAERHGHGLTVFVAGALVNVMVSVLIITLPPQSATPLWLLYTATGAVGVYSYGLATGAFPPALAGRVNTTLNFLVFFFAFVVQWLFGVILSALAGAAGEPTQFAYQIALSLLVGVTMLSFVPLFWLAPRREAAKAGPVETAPG